jgi:electron transfer flavoprotein-quinone oxidoreductase
MEKVECVVVGAGPAGSACALSLARRGVETVLLERGMRAGEKNVASFVLFTPVLKSLIPHFAEEAPLERAVTDQSFLFLQEKDFVQYRSRFSSFNRDGLAYTAFRSKFDAWFAEKAREAGAELLTGVLATDLLKKDGRVVGVKVGDEELRADVVVGADGIHTMVGRSAGLVEDDPRTYLLGVKEVLDLPGELIEERFQLSENQGAIQETFGFPVNDILGATTLYTNRDSISLAIFGWVDLIAERGISLYDRLQEFKAHPYIESLLKGAVLREYQAHILANGGRMDLGNLYCDGALLCGEAGGFMDYMYVGVPPAMLSGKIAADTIAEAKRRGDYSSETLRQYIPRLKETGLARMLYRSRRASKYLVKSGRKDLPVYLPKLMSIMESTLTDEADFRDPRPYTAGRDLYYSVIDDRIPPLLRRPARGALSLTSSLKARLDERRIEKEMR